MMEIKASLDGNMKVTAHFGSYHVVTDQPKEEGGDGAGPAPFDLFLASLATCTGFFVQRFCQTRGISTEGISVMQTSEWDEKAHHVSKVKVEIRLPTSFPEKYKSAVIAAANYCTVKEHLQNPPLLEVVTQVN